ncbi:MAG: hypothetical protein U9R50_00660 [Campylobacterota bacterium]|nr:hypothetical protein [Campylobacterota bacterium]
MAQRKITDEMLEDIEEYAADEYWLANIFDELKIAKSLMKDERVLAAYEKGQVQFFISLIANNSTDAEIIDTLEINADQCKMWREKYSAEIEHEKQKIADEEKLNTKQFSDPLYSGARNILNQNGPNTKPVSQQVLGNDIREMVKKVQQGDSSDLITMLTTNIIQFQMFNGSITSNLMGEAGKQLPNYERLGNMQIKVMREVRKSIMAINEITNPRRTTFIKEASQHNHLHQNSKKSEHDNELQSQLEKPKSVTDTEVFVSKEEVNEKEQ